MNFNDLIVVARAKAEADRRECRKMGFVFIDFLIDSFPGKEGVSVYHQDELPYPVSAYGFHFGVRNARDAVLDFYSPAARFTPRGMR